MVAVAAHTHDDVDWAARLPSMIMTDALQTAALADVARRLVTTVRRAEPTILDMGSGSGGMSAALAQSLAERQGGTIVLVDAVPELLDAATVAVKAAVGENPSVRIESVLADIADPELSRLAPRADLVWASGVVHHLPDQQQAVDGLARLLLPGGVLAIAEGGLDTRSLPWDLGVGTPGLEGRLNAARDLWFRELRETMPGAVRMPYGWSVALVNAGLGDISAFTYVVDHPAPTSDSVRHEALDRLAWFQSIVADRLDANDVETLNALLDPAHEHYLGARRDVFLLSAHTVHRGRAGE